jgi:hypothetical protein
VTVGDRTRSAGAIVLIVVALLGVSAGALWLTDQAPRWWHRWHDGVRHSAPAGMSATQLTHLLETNPAWRRQLNVGQEHPVWCGLHVFGYSKDGIKAYVWAECRGTAFGPEPLDYTTESGPLVLSKTPASIIVDKPDDVGYGQNVGRMFPASVADAIFSYDPKPLTKLADRRYRAHPAPRFTPPPLPSPTPTPTPSTTGGS